MNAQTSDKTGAGNPAENRAPGRPSGDLALRRRLLATARREFAAHGYRGVSVSVIARTAGATPAMVHYYFGNKQGLYRAVLDDALGPVLQRLEVAIGNPAETGDQLARIVRGYMRLLAESPDVPALIVRDVLSPGGQMREAFISGFAGRGGKGIRELVRRARDQGRLRADLDPDLAALSLLSMAVFPFIGAPVAGQVLDYSLDPGDIDRLADHTLELFFRGAGVRP